MCIQILGCLRYGGGCFVLEASWQTSIYVTNLKWFRCRLLCTTCISCASSWTVNDGSSNWFGEWINWVDGWWAEYHVAPLFVVFVSILISFLIIRGIGVPAKGSKRDPVSALKVYVEKKMEGKLFLPKNQISIFSSILHSVVSFPLRLEQKNFCYSQLFVLPLFRLVLVLSISFGSMLCCLFLKVGSFFYVQVVVLMWK